MQVSLSKTFNVLGIPSYTVSNERAQHGWVRGKCLLLGFPDGRKGQFWKILLSIERRKKIQTSSLNRATFPLFTPVGGGRRDRPAVFVLQASL